MDLSTKFMGIALKSPLVVSASPLSKDVSRIRQLEDAGAAAVVLYSLFEEQVEHEARELEYYYKYGADRFAESLSYFPEIEDFKTGPQEYLEHIRQAKQAVDIPIIGSLNGISSGGWTSYAKKMEQAGADGLELNVYYIPTDPDLPGEHVEKVHVAVLETVLESVSIPVAVKLSPFFSAIGNMARRLTEAGADGLVLFNRFYQPDISIEDMEVRPQLVLSDSNENRLPLRWIAILHGRVQTSLAATTGIHTPQDVVKMLLAGADATMLCSCLLKNGIGHMRALAAGLEQIMEKAGYESVREMKGALSQKNCPEPAAFERGNYLQLLSSYGPTATFE